MKLLLLFFTLFTLSFAKTTTDFSVIVHKPFNAALFDITEDHDRTITAVGFSNEFKQNANPSKAYTNAFDYLASVSNKYGAQMSLVKVDNQAKIILQKAAKLSRFNKAVAVVKTPTNGYFIGGYTMDGSLLVAKLDANANILYSKIFGTKNYDRMSSLILLSDGGVLAVGSSFTSRATTDNMFQTGLGNNDIFITRFSKDGHILWSKKYGTRFDDNGIDAVEAQDGSLLVVSTMASQRQREVTFMRLTENGNRIWLNQFIKNSHNENLVIPKKIIRLRDNSFVVTLIQYNQVQKEHIRLVKFDLYNNILADKEISTTYPSGLLDIKEFSNGMLMGVGYVKDKYNTDGLAMLLDSDLSMLKQEHYGGDNFDIFYALDILHNSQVAVAGIHTDDYSQEGNMWILKLNHDATIAQVSTKAGNFYDALCKLFAKEIKNGQLTIQEDLTIEFSDKALYFKVGAYKLTQEQKRFLSQIAKKLGSFLYANKDLVSTLQINGHTSSEWKNVNFENRYLKNEDLSMKRSFSVLREIFTTQDARKQKWLSKILRGSAYSFSKTVMQNGIENKKRSRRVTLKVLLN
ncbi:MULTISPECIES: OmpA family protein [Sulfurimonas]|uniref:OmpA family protein n=1 Tax=Sulfurimonas TaxID=202746 RepID=UPI001264866B|nr:OmpA family protein [Sulfurimonas indica]